MGIGSAGCKCSVAGDHSFFNRWSVDRVGVAPGIMRDG